MPVNVGVAIVTHPKRLEQALELGASVRADLIVTDDGRGEWATHARAWQWLSEQPGLTHGIVLQDDAVPVDDFRRHAAAAIEARPDDCVSFYTGTGFPLHVQPLIQFCHELASMESFSWLKSDRLFWGVGVALPLEHVPALLARDCPLPYDERIGDFCKQERVAVSYTYPSLVDHADGPSLVVHADDVPRLLPRRAWAVGTQYRPSDPESIEF